MWHLPGLIKTHFSTQIGDHRIHISLPSLFNVSMVTWDHQMLRSWAPFPCLVNQETVKDVLWHFHSKLRLGIVFNNMCSDMNEKGHGFNNLKWYRRQSISIYDIQAILINIFLSEILQIPTNNINYFSFNVPPSVLIIAPKHYCIFYTPVLFLKAKIFLLL